MGGGDDGGSADRAAKAEADKSAARAQINYLFGSGNSPDLQNAVSNIKQSDYMKDAYGEATPAYGDTPSVMGNIKVPDVDAYNAAVASAQAAADAAGNPNKVARDKIYQGVRDNAFTAGKRGLDETHDTAQRQNKFSLFAQGLNGGSEDIDQNALLDRTYNQGLLDLGAKADAAEADFKGNDESARLGLLQSIDAGTDQTSAVSSALSQLQNNSDSATAAANGTSLGDLFAQSGALYTKSQAAQGVKDANTAWWNQYNSANGTGKANSTARTGLVTNT